MLQFGELLINAFPLLAMDVSKWCLWKTRLASQPWPEWCSLCQTIELWWFTSWKWLEIYVLYASLCYIRFESINPNLRALLLLVVKQCMWQRGGDAMYFNEAWNVTLPAGRRCHLLSSFVPILKCPSASKCPFVIRPITLMEFQR